MSNPSHYQRLEDQGNKYFDDEMKALNRGDYKAVRNLHRKWKKMNARQHLAIENGEWFEPGDEDYEPDEE